MNCNSCYFDNKTDKPYCLHPFYEEGHPYRDEFMDDEELISCHTAAPCSLEVACLNTEAMLFSMGKIKELKPYIIPKEDPKEEK